MFGGNNAISDTTYEGRDIGENTAKSYVAQVKSFLPSFSRQGLESLLSFGDRGRPIEVKLRELTAGTVRAYLYTLQAFLKWFRAQPKRSNIWQGGHYSCQGWAECECHGQEGKQGEGGERSRCTDSYLVTIEADNGWKLSQSK